MAPVVLYPDRLWARSGRRGRFHRLSAGVSIIRYWHVSDAVADVPETVLPQAAAADEPMTRERRAGQRLTDC